MNQSILYIHGLNSSAHSRKSRQLVAAMRRIGLDAQISVPSLHHDPRQAIAQLEEAITRLGRPLLVGSSLGGYYATFLAQHHGLKALMINPGVSPHRLLPELLGQQINLYSGEVWQLTDAHLAALAELELPPPADPERFQVWLQTADETIDYRLAERYYRGCRLRIQAGGDHGYQGFAKCIPALLAFAGIAPDLWWDTDFSDL